MSGIIIVAIVFAFALIVTKMGLDYNRDRLNQPAGSGDDHSLGTSELKALIRESVAEEIEPLTRKLEALETRRLPAPDDDTGDIDSSGESGKSAPEAAPESPEQTV